MNNNSYMLKELIDINIDSWVEGLSHLIDQPGVMKEAYAMKGWEFPESESDWECPAELEIELTCIANRDKYRFDEDGNIISFDCTKNY